MPFKEQPNHFYSLNIVTPLRVIRFQQLAFSVGWMIVANVAIAKAPHFFVKFVLYYTQGRINQWANRGKYPAPQVLGDLALEYQNTPLLVFHVFRLFTTRQKCWAFWWLRLVYRLSKLTVAFIVWVTLKIEPHSITFQGHRFNDFK